MSRGVDSMYYTSGDCVSTKDEKYILRESDGGSGNRQVDRQTRAIVVDAWHTREKERKVEKE